MRGSFLPQRFASALRRDRDHGPQQIGDRCPRDGNGSFVVPLPRDVLDKLNYLRGPGESYSEVILRVAKGERGDLMTTHGWQTKARRANVKSAPANTSTRANSRTPSPRWARNLAKHPELKPNPHLFLLGRMRVLDGDPAAMRASVEDFR